MIAVLSGVNQFALNEKKAELVESFQATHGSTGIEVYSAEKLSPADVPTLMSGASLFAPQRLVIISRLSENKEVAQLFLDRLETVPEEVSIILIEGLLDKRTQFYKTLKQLPQFQEFPEPSDVDLLRWMKSFAAQREGSFISGSERTLLEYVGNDQSRLNHEIIKLVNFEPHISKESIDRLVDKKPTDTIFQLLDSVLSQNFQQALQIVQALEKAFEDPYQVANMLAWQVTILAVVHSAKNKSVEEVAKDTKINPYVIRKTKNLALRLSHQKLRSIITTVAELDVRLKSTANEPWRVVEHAVLATSR